MPQNKREDPLCDSGVEQLDFAPAVSGITGPSAVPVRNMYFYRKVGG